MLNYKWFPLEAEYSLEPYVGLGAGAAIVSIDGDFSDDEDTVGALKLALGLDVRTSSSLIPWVELGYVYASNASLFFADVDPTYYYYAIGITVEFGG